MADYDVSIRFNADDKISPAFNRIGLRINMFTNRLTNSFGKASKSALGLKTVIGGILGASAIQRGIGVLSTGVRDLTTEFLDFDQAITGAAAKWGISRGTDEFRELGTVARDVAKVTPYSAGQAGAGLDYLAMAGFTASQAMASLPGVTQLAIASNTDLAEASDIASDALSSLGLMTSDSAKLTENLTRVNDVFAKTTITSNTNLQMLFEGMKEVAPVAAGLGREVEELSAMMGTLANAGIKSTQGGTALRNMYLRLTSGTAEVTKVLKKYKIEVTDSSGKMRSMIDIIDDVRKKTEGLNDETKQAAYTHLFGTRAVAAATVLMRAGGEELHRYERSLQNATGAAKKLADEMSKSWSNRLKAMKSKLIELGLKVFDVFEDDIPKAFDAVDRWLDSFDAKAFQREVKQIAEDVKPLVAGMGDLARAGGKLADWFRSNKIGIKEIALAFGGWKLAVAGLNTALGTTKGTLGGILALKGLPALLKFMGAGSAAAGGVVAGGAAAGAIGAAYVGSKAVKEQKESYDRFAEMWRKEKALREDKKWEGKILSRASLESIKDKYKGDPALADLAYQRAQETGVLPVSQERTPMIAPRFTNVPTSEKSVVEVNVKAPEGTTAAVKQGRGAPRIRANLGRQRRRPRTPSLTSDELAAIHGLYEQY